VDKDLVRKEKEAYEREQEFTRTWQKQQQEKLAREELVTLVSYLQIVLNC